MSNSLERYKIVKLEGSPLLLTPNLVRPITEQEQKWAVSNIMKFFGWPSSKAAIALAQIFDSTHSDINNLCRETILDYCNKGGQETIMVFWNGDTDKLILNYLNLTHRFLNIKAYDTCNDKQFDLQLLLNNQIISIFPLGHVDKTGRMLNLLEAHNCCCHKDHKITHAHDPCADVTLTKCLLDKLIRKMTFKTLINILQ